MATAETDPNGYFLLQIGDQVYRCEIYIYNQINGYKPFLLQQLQVHSFSIQESLLTWITQGWIVINNDFEIMERGAPATSRPGYDKPIDPTYVFRADGRNRISFRIYPVNKKLEENEEEYRKNWEICYDFVIYDVEDVPTGNNQKKQRKFYFWDERYQLFSERNIEYSSVYTANKSVGLDYSNLTDKQKAANPSDVLKDIIKTASKNPPIITNTTNDDILKVGFKDGGSIDNPTEPVYNIDEKNWDAGLAGNKILFTSPANFTAVDDINYVLDFCVSKDNGPVFLEFGRTTNDKTWKLLSLSQIFENSDINQVERLFIADSVTYESQATTSPSLQRASIESDTVYDSKNFTSSRASKITNYRFSPMVSIDDFKIRNLPIHSYDFSTGAFNINFSNNSVKALKKAMEEHAQKGLYSFKNSLGEAQIKINLNQTKTKGINLENNFLPQTFFPKNYGQITMMRDLLFLSDAISFDVQGLTVRTPGKFVNIDRIGSTAHVNPFDNRFLGQWLITKVNHVFTQKSYTNEIVAVKVDSYDKLWDVVENKY